jgi:hypothetical protein
MRNAAADVPSFPASVNLLPPERNREVMDDDELVAAMASGGDTALRESFARPARAGWRTRSRWLVHLGLRSTIR